MLENEADSAQAEGTDNETTAASGTSGAETSGVTTRPRRRASRPAGPPPEIEESPAPEQTAQDEPVEEDEAAADDGAEREPVAESADEPAAEGPAAAAEPAPAKKTTRTRTRKSTKAAEPAKAAEQAETAAPVPPTGAETSPEIEGAPAAEAATKPAEEPAEEPEEKAAEKAPASRTRTRRRTAAKTAEPSAETAAPAEPPAASAEVPPPPTVPPAVPSVPEVPAVPVAGASPGTEQVSETEPASGIAVPGVTFQPPMVVFQPPQPKPEDAARREEAVKAAAETAEREAADEEPDERDERDDRDERASDGDDSDDRPSRRRRRRGGRGRGRNGKDGADDEIQGTAAEETEDEQPPADKGKADKPKERSKPDRQSKAAKAKDAKDAKDKDAKSKDAKDQAEEADSDFGEDDDSDQGASSRRRRRRRRRSGGDGDGGGTDDPPNTVVHVRDARAVEDEVQSVRGSTRLEAKKQRRREGREQGRRRPPVITEAEFLARRESVERVMVVRQEGERTQIAVLEDDVLVEHYVNRATHQSYVGNVYLGKVQNVLPSMEAAFVDVGKGRNAVLYAGEVNWDVAGLVGQPRRIESALKSGQSVLVQVTKDPLGHKGARLTSQVSLPGRYLVYVPDGSMTGISRKLPDKERSRLKQILKKVMPDNAGVIVRTAAEGATEEELSRDVSRLAAQWESIQKKVKTASAPSLLYGEPDLTIRVVRDIFNEDFSKLVVSGAGAWDTVSEYVQYVAPHLADRVERWTDDQDVLGAFRVDEQIAKALDRKVWLPSGGSLVIDRTEAMTVVDVNTGKFTGQGGNLEETVTRNNLEAAEEIVRQLRLRDIGGIVVIDFIDMVLESNRDLVLRRLVECLSRDRTKHQVAEVTSLGLVQMTRKRVGQGLLEAFSETCESCNGRGIHVHLTPVEPKADKEVGGRRRKRKGEVEKAVEEKLAKSEKADAKAGRGEREPKPEPEPAKDEVKAEPAKGRRGRAARSAAAEPVAEEAAEPVRTRPRKSRPAKRPAGPPPEPDADEAQPAQAEVEAAQAAAETADVAPGTLDAAEPEPVAVQANGSSNGAAHTAATDAPAEAAEAPAPAEPVAPAEAAAAGKEGDGEAEAADAPRRTRTRRSRVAAQAADGADD
ncbi:ribonuclease E/G [Actinomadura sp. LOL_016]|uniref:Rne/Rng family ribonuclease n=1 Tax=Actinomadura sp. LOL_016 TaxID=3345411 RepID=UPI003A8963B8